METTFQKKYSQISTSKYVINKSITRITSISKTRIRVFLINFQALAKRKFTPNSYFKNSCLNLGDSLVSDIILEIILMN